MNSTVRELRKSFCKEQKLKLSSVRFLLDGVRVNDMEKFKNMKEEEGCLIDAVIGQTAGGRFPKRNIFKDEDEIRKQLEINDDEQDETDIESNGDKSDSENEGKINDADELTDIKSVTERSQNPDMGIISSDPNQCQKDSQPSNLTEGFKDYDDNGNNMYFEPRDVVSAGEFGFENLTKTISRNDLEIQNMQNSGLEHIGQEQLIHKARQEIKRDLNSKEQEDTPEETTKWLDDLRKQDKFSSNSPIDKKIMFLLSQPKLAEVEIHMLKCQLEFREHIQSVWDDEAQTDPYNTTKIKRKRKLDVQSSSSQMKLRRKPNSKSNLKGESEDDFENEKGIDSKSNEENTNSNPFCEIYNKEREALFSICELSMPSPAIKSKQPSEMEFKRMSVAIHLWSHQKYGGVQFLSDIPLTDKHFKEIIEFAGPNSKWNLLKNRSITQCKNMWQNKLKGKYFYHGHKESGFETEYKVHDTSSTFCPFNHCKQGVLSPFDVDLMLLTPDKQSSQPVETSSLSVNRRLFTPEKNFRHSQAVCRQESDSFKEPFMKEPEEVEMLNSSEKDRPSPTKEELKAQNKYLQQEICKIQGELDEEKIMHAAKNKSLEQTSSSLVFECEIENCGKRFTSVFGLNNHQKCLHPEKKIEQKQKHLCPFCGNSVLYIDQHMNQLHKDLVDGRKCEICQEVIKGNLKKHRGECNSCPFCDYKEKKKKRLIKHIEDKHKNASTNVHPGKSEEPMDLSTPKKDMEEIRKISIETTNKKHTDEIQIQTDETNTPCHEKEKIENYPRRPLDSNANSTSVFWNQKRTMYPFDKQVDDESYVSEFDENDEEAYTLNRRESKDILEMELRNIDTLENSEKEGDEIFLKKFKQFEIKKRTSKVSTVDMYTSAIQHHILPAFHKLYHPFNALWILDCTTVKNCRFEGKERVFVNPEEPIYLTSRIVEESCKAIDSYGGKGGSQRGTLLAAVTDLVEFIEFQFNHEMNIYGPEPLAKLAPYHNGVKSFLKGTGSWKASNDEKAQAHENRKVMETYENPNKEAEILENYHSYIKSEGRLDNINKVLGFAQELAPIPTPGEMTEIGNIIMGEVVCATGCRPVVVRRLTEAAYGDKTPGFNPRRVSDGDRVLEEESGNSKIYRRVNPSLPPREKACQHQLREKTAECSVSCSERCEPDGFNIFVTWDKTQGTKGPSYLHLTKPLKILMDCYAAIRSRFFENKKPTPQSNADWLTADTTTFFLNSSCSEFQFIDLKHISDEMGCDVKAYDFRRIVCTWGLSHDDSEIREAEEQALQHSVDVARERYQQNKQIKPQTFTQKYSQEENLFPKNILNEIEKTEAATKERVKKADENRTKRRFSKLKSDREAYRKAKEENRPLGPKHRIQRVDRERFKILIEQMQDQSMNTLLKDLKPLKWRNKIVRLVCSGKGEIGNELREVWKRIYKGDLRWGVRDARMKNKEKNCQKKYYGQDRNSWIAASLKKSLLTAKKNISESD